MKARNGFVSNSSSSSFVIGAAKVLDKDKVSSLLEDADCKILTRKGVETYANSRSDYDVELWNGNLILKAHTNDEEPCWVNLDDGDDCFLVVNVGHDEGDGPFFKEHFYGLDYSVANENYFKDNYPETYKLLLLLQGTENLTEPLSYRFGVSRNG